VALGNAKFSPTGERIRTREYTVRLPPMTHVVLAAAHLDHDPTNNRLRNLRSLCQRCHLIHDRPHHLAQRRITYLLRRASGDLFLGPYWATAGALVAKPRGHQ
jgi:hypothetical protein